MSKYEELKKVVYGILYPDGIPLEFGCLAMIKDWGLGRIYMTSQKNIWFESIDQEAAVCVQRKEGKVEEILGPDLTLQDILRTLQHIRSDMRTRFNGDRMSLIFMIETITIFLSKQPKDRKEEKLQSILDLLT